MRRTRSQLKNLSAPAAQGHPHAAQQYGVNPHAEEVQRRINALGMAHQSHPEANYAAPNYSNYAPQPMPAQSQIYGHPAAMPGAPGTMGAPAAYGYPSHEQNRFAPNPELEVLKSHIDAMSGKLAEVERLSTTGVQHASAQAQQTSAQVSEMVGQRIGSLTAQISDLSNVVAGLASTQSGMGDIGGFRKALEDASRAFADFSANQATSAINPDAYAKVVEQSHQTLAGEIEQMRQTFASGNANSDIYTKTLEATHDDLKAQMMTLQQTIAANLDKTGEKVGRLQEGHAGLLGEIETIKTLIQETDGAGDAASSQDVANIELRLEEITRAIVAISYGGNNVDQLERLEARISDLSRNFSEQPSTSSAVGANGDIEEIKSQLVAMSDQLAGLSARPEPAADMSWSTAVEALHDKLDNMHALGAHSSGEGQDNAQLLDRLDALVERVGPATGAEEISRLSNEVSSFGALLANTSGFAGQSEPALDNVALQGLDQKLNEIVEHLSGGNAPVDVSTIEQKLTSIEEQIASSRDIAIELANQAAMDAVNQAIQHLHEHRPADAGHAVDSPVLSDLANDIRSLEQNSSQNNVDTIQTFDALRETLEHMVGRLASIEESINAGTVPAAAYAAPVQQAVTPDETYEPPMPDAQPEHPHAEAQTSNQIDQFDALLSEREPEPEAPAPRKVSVAQSLVEEANRAEEQRQRQREAQMVEPEFETNNSREFNSEELAADTFEDLDGIQSELPEQAAPGLDVDAFPMAPVQNEAEMPPANLGDETPLEPGSGGPDLAALVRQANERRKTLAKNGSESAGTDFIAAARRAAQAAAEEASAAQAAPETEEPAQSKGLMSALPDLFSRRKKTLAMAAAVALLGAIAIPIAGSLMGPDKPAQVSQVEEVDPENVQDPGNVQDIVTSATETPSDEQELEAPSRVVEVPQVDMLSEPLEPVQPVQATSLSDPEQQFETPAQTDGFSFVSELEFGNEQLKAAVASGDPAALFEVGRRYMDGHGTQKDIKKAALWYGRAAEKGFAPAQYLVGNFDEKGIVSERDTASAVSWYKKAASNGNVIAMHNLAVLHATPNGASEQPDLPKAYEWFRQAADHGVRDSQVNLGIFYTKGVGTQVDLVEAYKWFTLAAKAGDKDAENKRGVIADALRPDQLAEAKTRVENWKPAEIKQAANTVPANSEWTKDLAQAPVPTTKQVVAKTQTLLSKLGFDAGPADGIMGSKTREAIARFQQRAGLSVNGKITAELLRELEAVAI